VQRHRRRGYRQHHAGGLRLDGGLRRDDHDDRPDHGDRPDLDDRPDPDDCGHDDNCGEEDLDAVDETRPVPFTLRSTPESVSRTSGNRPVPAASRLDRRSETASPWAASWSDSAAAVRGITDLCPGMIGQRSRFLGDTL
jgi:hypothetical protein